MSVIRWRRLDQRASEFASLKGTEEGAFLLHGAVNGELPDGRHYALEYDVWCASDWITRECRIEGTLGDEGVRMTISRDASSGRWAQDGVAVPELDACLDIDLGFSPATNTLPILRLGLDVGAAATVRAAWLRFPQLRLELLEQVYRRTGTDRYEYESGGGSFRSELEVDAAGWVRRYGEYWVAESEPDA